MALGEEANKQEFAADKQTHIDLKKNRPPVLHNSKGKYHNSVTKMLTLNLTPFLPKRLNEPEAAMRLNDPPL